MGSILNSKQPITLRLAFKLFKQGLDEFKRPKWFCTIAVKYIYLFLDKIKIS